MATQPPPSRATITYNPGTGEAHVTCREGHVIIGAGDTKEEAIKDAIGGLRLWYPPCPGCNLLRVFS